MGMLPWVYANFFWTQTVWKCRNAMLGDQCFHELALGQSQRRKQAFSKVAYTPEAVGRKYGYFVSARHSHCRCQGFDSPMLHGDLADQSLQGFFMPVFYHIGVCRSCTETLEEFPQRFSFALCGPGTGLRLNPPISSSGSTRAFSGVDLGLSMPARFTNKCTAIHT